MSAEIPWGEMADIVILILVIVCVMFQIFSIFMLSYAQVPEVFPSLQCNNNEL